MNSTKVQNLVILYKSQTGRHRCSTWRQILAEFEAILTALIRDAHDTAEARLIAEHELFAALERYNPHSTSKAKFATYAHNFLLGVRGKLIRQLGYFKAPRLADLQGDIPDDFYLDLPRLLTEEEKLAFHRYCNESGRISHVVIDRIYRKIANYLEVT